MIVPMSFAYVELQSSNAQVMLRQHRKGSGAPPFSQAILSEKVRC